MDESSLNMDGSNLEIDESSLIGQRIIAVGAEDIVTGKARYCPDLQFPGMLIGKLLYS
ncbi:MAG: hypothetical protein IIB73_04685, partial [Proteobacteria bacterium]|nr:hypothetical protein [Pseudomonadota bacterium]